ncbi:hypothetical protein PMIT1320_00917 [Prochlorococcus marinus str. MIT 1320]|nr:hypothetical protein PMIT1320_00917 [Prochlorococcus marinus str. MIT 1320]
MYKGKILYDPAKLITLFHIQWLTKLVYLDLKLIFKRD